MALLCLFFCEKVLLWGCSYLEPSASAFQVLGFQHAAFKIFFFFFNEVSCSPGWPLTYCVAEPGLELLLSQPPIPGFWGYRCAPPLPGGHLTIFFNLYLVIQR